MSTRNREIEALKESQKKLGGITPSKLSHDTIVWVDTDTFIYKITVNKTDKITYVIDSGSRVLPKKPCVDINSYCPLLKYDIKDWIGKGLRLVMIFSDASVITTGIIIGAMIIVKGCKYELWKED